MSEQVMDAAKAESIRKALGFFKIMAFIAGVALFILIVVVVIHYGFDNPRPSETWSPIHGLIYMVYVVSVAMLGFRAGWPLSRMVKIMLAGFVPGLPFYVERKVAAEVTAQLAGQPGR